MRATTCSAAWTIWFTDSTSRHQTPPSGIPNAGLTTCNKVILAPTCSANRMAYFNAALECSEKSNGDRISRMSRLGASGATPLECCPDGFSPGPRTAHINGLVSTCMVRVVLEKFAVMMAWPCGAKARLLGRLGVIAYGAHFLPFHRVGGRRHCCVRLAVVSQELLPCWPSQLPWPGRLPPTK